jgi:hypothetical protein
MTFITGAAEEAVPRLQQMNPQQTTGHLPTHLNQVFMANSRIAMSTHLPHLPVHGQATTISTPHIPMTKENSMVQILPVEQPIFM